MFWSWHWQKHIVQDCDDLKDEIYKDRLLLILFNNAQWNEIGIYHIILTNHQYHFTFVVQKWFIQFEEDFVKLNEVSNQV